MAVHMRSFKEAFGLGREMERSEQYIARAVSKTVSGYLPGHMIYSSHLSVASSGSRSDIWGAGWSLQVSVAVVVQLFCQRFGRSSRSNFKLYNLWRLFDLIRTQISSCCPRCAPLILKSAIFHIALLSGLGSGSGGLKE